MVKLLRETRSSFMGLIDSDRKFFKVRTSDSLRVQMRIGEVSITTDKNLLLCLQCGECTGSCPLFITAPEKYNPRRIVERLVLEGVKPYDLAWLCLTCYECLERCPAGVSIAEMMERIKNEASEKGEISETAKQVLNNLLQTGREVKITKSELLRREQLGLEPMPTTMDEEIIKLLEITGLKNLLSEGKNLGREN